jgi:hypothetical protein
VRVTQKFVVANPSNSFSELKVSASSELPENIHISDRRVKLSKSSPGHEVDEATNLYQSSKPNERKAAEERLLSLPSSELYPGITIRGQVTNDLINTIKSRIEADKYLKYSLVEASRILPLTIVVMSKTTLDRHNASALNSSGYRSDYIFISKSPHPRSLENELRERSSYTRLGIPAIVLPEEQAASRALSVVYSRGPSSIPKSGSEALKVLQNEFNACIGAYRRWESENKGRIAPASPETKALLVKEWNRRLVDLGWSNFPDGTVFIRGDFTFQFTSRT